MFGTDKDHNLTYKFCTNYCSQVNNHKHGDDAKR